MGSTGTLGGCGVSIGGSSRGAPGKSGGGNVPGGKGATGGNTGGTGPGPGKPGELCKPGRWMWMLGKCKWKWLWWWWSFPGRSLSGSSPGKYHSGSGSSVLSFSLVLSLLLLSLLSSLEYSKLTESKQIEEIFIRCNRLLLDTARLTIYDNRNCNCFWRFISWWHIKRDRFVIHWDSILRWVSWSNCL